MIIKNIKFKLIIFLTFFAKICFAIDYQEYLFIHNSNQCNNYFDHVERKFNIPKDLLRSISIAETGRWQNKSKTYLPWPWAVNQAGDSYYFKNKKQAIEAVKKMLEQGITNIDIGCMQINLHHHPEAFLNLNQAFEAKDNIEYAAKFLVKHYQYLGSWEKSVAAYHSFSENGKNYAKKVLTIWSNYKKNKLEYANCIGGNNFHSSCIDTTISKKTVVLEKEELLISNNNDKSKASKSRKITKDLKRIKSNMILYSLSN